MRNCFTQVPLRVIHRHLPFSENVIAVGEFILVGNEFFTEPSCSEIGCVALEAGLSLPRITLFASFQSHFTLADFDFLLNFGMELVGVISRGANDDFRFCSFFLFIQWSWVQESQFRLSCIVEKTLSHLHDYRREQNTVFGHFFLSVFKFKFIVA